MSKALVRSNDLVFKPSFTLTAFLALTLTVSPLGARAAEDVAKELQPGVYVLKSGVVTMTPIADRPAKPEVAVVTASAAATAPAPQFKPGVVAMAPISDDDEPAAKSATKLAKSELHCLATAIYFEARGESARGQKAVAEVILRRTKTPGRPKTVCGVVYEGSHRKSGCQFSFTCDGASDVARPGPAWQQAQRVATSALKARGKGRAVVKGATFYHAHYVRPAWARRMVRVAQIGSHIFYRPKRGRLL